MALLLNQEYIVVEDVSPSTVTIRFHADAAHRARYKAGTETKYETTQQETRSVPVDMTKLADASVSIKDNNIIAGYEALKTTEEFKDAISS